MKGREFRMANVRKAETKYVNQP